MGRLHRLIRRAARIAAWGGAALLVLAVALVTAAWLMPLPERLSMRDASVVDFRDGTPAHVFLSEDDKWRVGVTLGEVAPAYVEALLRLEDKRFYAHLGVDPLAVARAAAQNLWRGRIVSGASTITMQLARLLEPRPRTFRSKIIEAFRSLQLELHFSKAEILEAYLRFVPYGRNLEGVEAASLAYFGHRATALSPDEIATLLAVPQAPNRYFPRPRNAARLRAARDRIALRLFDVSAAARATAAPVPQGLRPFPRRAPHAARWLRARFPNRRRLRTTLDAGAQATVERVLAVHRAAAVQDGVHNAAVVLIDHRAAEVRALVGNFDFDDAGHGGQIVGFDAPRSPGSLLKPVIYALAIDGGLVLPDHLVRDTPLRYGTYAPINFDGRFAGLVRLEDALSRSLNVPFVRLLARIGVERFLGALRQLGAAHLDGEPGHYGLSAAVGGVEVTPLEAAGIFAALAEDGRYRAPGVRAGGETVEALAVFTPGAAWLTRRALSMRDRPDFPERRRFTHLPPSVHWKTGTSFGYRDAWAVGSGPTYTAAVWLGNFDYAASGALVGADAAGPVLFDVLDGVADRRHRPPADLPTSDLVRVQVCAYSGYLPTDACPERREALAPVRSVPPRRCPFHARVEVDAHTGLAVTPECRAGRRTEVRSFVIWPASIRRWLRDQRRRLPELPRYAPGCAPPEAARPPAIVSPPPSHAILLIPGLPADRQEVPLEAESRAPARLSWFVDGVFLGTVAADGRMWWPPTPGRHEVRVVDETGLSSARTLVVRAGRR